MLRCCLEDEADKDLGVDPAPPPSDVEGVDVEGKEAVERGVPGIEDGSTDTAMGTGVSAVGADVDVTSGETDRWGAETWSNRLGDVALA